MSKNIKNITSSEADNNPLFNAWHEQHHKTACHHGSYRKLSGVAQTYLLLGTPNVGKSTFFNKITTATAAVSNIDRLTVEDTIGRYRDNKSVVLVDLPGIYNLSHPIDEEKVVAHEIFGEHFDKIINIIGAQSIQRDLMLTLQCIETGLLNTVVINMVDEVHPNAIDVKKMSQYLNNANITLTQANRNIGIKKVSQSSLKNKLIAPDVITYSPQIESYIRKLSNVLPSRKISNRFYALMLLEGNEYIKTELQKHFPIHYEKVKQILGSTCFYKEIINAKRHHINKIIQNSTTITQAAFVRVPKHKHQKVDRIVLNKWIGIPLFLFLIVAIYFISFSPWTGGGLQTLIADDLCDKLIIGNIQSLYENASPAVQWVGDLFTDGVLNGFFVVLSFIPVIVILFVLVNIINQVGILSRVSVLLDQTFEKFGISGRSIVNLLTGFGCNVPAIMLARSANSKKERIISILIAPFLACSARVIVIAYVSNFLFGNLGWITMIIFIIASGLIALFMGLIFSKTLFRKTRSFFLIEMVDWRKPDLVVIAKTVWLEIKQFIKKAAKFIVAASLLIWLLLHICPTQPFSVWHESDDNVISNSLLGYTAKGMQYLFVPIGFGDIGSGTLRVADGWKLTASLLSAIPAKEIAIANINMLWPNNSFNISVPEGLSYMVMIMLMTSCMATMAVLKKEGGWKNLGISLMSSFGAAYIIAAVVYWTSFLIVR